MDFAIQPTAGARPLDADAAHRLARIAGADSGTADADGAARVRFAGGIDAATAEGRLQMAARMELGAHWQTRYRLIAL